jgi:hypothetical protein
MRHLRSYVGTIVTSFGKFQYCRMAMGLKISPDVAQSIIEQVLRDLDVNVYIDDIFIFSDSWEDHCKAIDAVLERLQDNGFKVNPLKCEWGMVDETYFIRHWLTPTCVKPWKKKINAILKMERPQNITQLHSFLGAVTYYRNMWPRCSHLLAPLTELTGKSMFEWTSHCDKAFEEMKAVMSADTLMQYPNINIPFNFYTDSSDYQMGVVIMQNGKPVAYWAWKLNEAQRNYPTMEKELLAILYCLIGFRTMLWGARLTVFTDHHNLTFCVFGCLGILDPIGAFMTMAENSLVNLFKRYYNSTELKTYLLHHGIPRSTQCVNECIRLLQTFFVLPSHLILHRMSNKQSRWLKTLLLQRFMLHDVQLQDH